MPEIDTSRSPCAATVLIVEDEIAIADALRYVLRGAGLRCVYAATLRDACNFIATETPSLLILDLGLPDGSGLDLCRDIRRSVAPARGRTDSHVDSDERRGRSHRGPRTRGG